MLSKIWDMIDRVNGLYGTEDEQRWVERLERVNREIERLWDENRGVVEGAEPRYLEGFPVRMRFGPPVARGPLRRVVERKVVRCLGCVVERLRCSLGEGGCLRCERRGEVCRREEGNEVGDEEEVERVGKVSFAPVWPGKGEMDCVLGRCLGNNV